MTSESRARAFNRIMVAVATATMAAGCTSTDHYASNRYYEPAPVVTTSDTTGMRGTGSASMGGTGSAYATQAGAGSSSQSSSNVVIPLQREELRVGTQQVDAGGVRLRKVVTTETVNQPVQLRKESLVVDRTPANGAQGGTAGQAQTSGQSNSLSTPFQEGELVVTLRQERPVVQTEVVPAGSVVVQKQVIIQPTTVQRQVRQENIQAEKIGNSPDISISSNLAGSTNINEAVGAGPSASGQSRGAGGSGITQLNQLTAAPDPTTLAGQQVNIAGAKVQQLSGDRMLVVAGPDGRSIHVRTAQPISGISQGDTVMIKGTVRPASSAATLGLDQQTTQMLQSEKVFIDATTVSPASGQ